jgi:hypothetical protein
MIQRPPGYNQLQNISRQNISRPGPSKIHPGRRYTPARRLPQHMITFGKEWQARAKVRTRSTISRLATNVAAISGR